MRWMRWALAVSLSVNLVGGGMWLIARQEAADELPAVTAPEPLRIVEQPYYLDRAALFAAVNPAAGSIVFLGDSLTDYCEWGELLGNPNIKNRGIAGDTTYGVLQRLTTVVRLQPAKLFLLIGSNDLGEGRPVADIARDYELLVKRCRTEMPATALYLESVPPINFKLSSHFESNRKVVELNQAIQRIAAEKQAVYIDLHQAVAGEQGELRTEYTTDGLHFNAAGYQRWKALLQPYLL